MAARDASISHLEVVGLHGQTNGRSCERHECCGRAVVVGDVLRIKRGVANINGSIQEAIKFVSIRDFTEACTVGFSAKATHKRLEENGYINRFVEVTELYEFSSNSFHRRKSHMNKGMAKCKVLNVAYPVQIQE